MPIKPKNNHRNLMTERIRLPSRKQSLDLPTRPMLTTLDVTLEMTIHTIHCQHLGLDQIPLFIGRGLIPNNTTRTAEKIVEQAEALRNLIEIYLTEIDDEYDNITSF